MRAWREEVEHSQQGIKDHPDRYKIRRVGRKEEDEKHGYKQRTARAAKKAREAAKARVTTRARQASDAANAAANAAPPIAGNANDGFANNQLTLMRPALLLAKSPAAAKSQ